MCTWVYMQCQLVNCPPLKGDPKSDYRCPYVHVSTDEICVYRYIYICVYVRIYMCTYVYMCEYVCMYLYVHICVHMYICNVDRHPLKSDAKANCTCQLRYKKTIFMYICKCVYTCIYVCTHVYMYIYEYENTNICICM